MGKKIVESTSPCIIAIIITERCQPTQSPMIENDIDQSKISFAGRESKHSFADRKSKHKSPITTIRDHPRSPHGDHRKTAHPEQRSARNNDVSPSDLAEHTNCYRRWNPSWTSPANSDPAPQIPGPTRTPSSRRPTLTNIPAPTHRRLRVRDPP
jgi:hypothetical protein